MNLSKYFWKVIENIVLAIFLSMLILVIAQIFFRYVINISVPWTEEAARWFYIWQIFLGSALAMKRQLHLKITFFKKKVSARIQKWLETGSALIGLLFLGGIWWGSVKMMKTVYTVYAGSFNIRVTYLYLVLPISIGLMIVLGLKEIKLKMIDERNR